MIAKEMSNAMKTLIPFIATGLVVGVLAQPPSQPPKPGPELTFDGSKATQVKRDLKVLELSGSGYERGLQHGRQLRSEIAKILDLWKEDLRKHSKLDPDSLIRTLLAETSFTPAIKQWTPDLLDEVRGIAAGSGQPFETIFAFQLLDEIWVFLDKRATNRCSAMGVAKGGDHPAYVAQNMDLESFRDGFQVVLHITGHESTPEQFVFTQAGMIALNGVNRHSIGIVCNALMQLNASSNGLPVAFVLRGVLAHTNDTDALKFVKNVPHASGQNYIIGVGDRVYDFEASAGKVVEFRRVPNGSVVYHTNHRLVNDDLKPSLSADWEKGLMNSQTRFASLQTRLGKPASAIDAGVIKETLRSKDSELHPVCQSLNAGAGGFTFGATIMTLSETPSLEVTLGPPDVNPFVRLEFSTGAGHSQSAEPPSRKAIVVRAARLLDVRAGQYVQDPVIVIEGARIKAAGARLAVPAGVEVIDLGPATLLPGLIDCHTHLMGDIQWEKYGTALLTKSQAYRALEGAAHARRMLYAGFTTVSDEGNEGSGYADVALRDAINAGLIEGPRLQVATRAIAALGQYQPFDVSSDLPDFPRGAQMVSGTDSVRRAVREQIANGADLIKVYADWDYPTLTVDELRVAVEEAHKARRRVAAHATTVPGIRNALTAGVDSIVHGWDADQQTLELMQQKGVWLVPTVGLAESRLEQAPSAEERDRHSKQLARTRTMMALALKVGVRIGSGYDAIEASAHGANAREIAALVHHGLSALEAIRAATLYAAERMGWSDRVGAVEPGKYADLIAVAGDPLTAVQELEQVRFVMKGGTVVRRDSTPVER
jgi:imidazolonepropionase-like amidohydrolase/predicted choloylglycine hydrolase